MTNKEAIKYLEQLYPNGGHCWLDEQRMEAIDMAVKALQEEPVSENFEEALAKEWKGYNDRGAATVDALEDNTQELAFAKGFYRGAKWKNEQMMTKAADMVVGYQMPNGLMLTVDETENCYDINEDDRVKVIVIKKD